MMPGASAGNVNPAQARVPRVRLQAQAPSGYKNKTGALVDGGQLAAGEIGAARAHLRKGAAVQGALQDIGRDLGGALQRIVLAREKAEVDEANMEQDLAWEVFKRDLPADPSDWNESFAAKVDELRDSILSDDKPHSKALREYLERNFDKWTAVSSTRLQTMAVERNRSISVAKSNAAAQQALEFEDMDRFAEVTLGMVRSGLITQAEAQLRIDRAKRQIGRVQFFRDLEDDPHSVSEALEFGAIPEGFSPADLDKAKKYAKQQMKRVEAEEAREDADWIAENRHMGMDEVKERLDGRHYGAGVRESLMQDWRDDPNRKIDFAKVSEVKQRNRTLTHASSEEAKHQGYLDALEAAPRGWVREHLLESFGGSIGDHTGSNFNAMLKTGMNYADSVIDRELSAEMISGKFGDIGDDPGNAQVRLRLSEAIRQELGHWLRQNEDASADQVFDFLETLGIPIKQAKEGGIDMLLAPGIYKPPPNSPEDGEDEAAKLLNRKGEATRKGFLWSRRSLWKHIIDPINMQEFHQRIFAEEPR
jgi:hypothetical protein